jgi:lysophospholipase L1-like esterase
MLRLLALLASVVLLGASGLAGTQATGASPAADARPPLNPALPTIFIAGDSTAARGAGDRQQGWGEPFAAYFDPAVVNVVNRARGGRSSRTFITEELWDQLVADLKAGDTVLIQFGHHDGGAHQSSPRRCARLR